MVCSCTAVYASVYGKGEDGKKLYTKADLTNGHSYFLTITVENISIEIYGKIVFTVTPYIVNENGVKNAFYSAYATFDDGLRDTSADGTEPLSKEKQILNGFTVATQTTPTLHEIDGLQPTGEYEGIQAVWFDGMDQNGSKTKVFAYVGFPEGASEDAKVPAVVLLHGGGDTPFFAG